MADPRPLVLMIDEIDALVGDTLLAVLRQLRTGYVDRPARFPHSIILCGVRDVRDYRIHSSAENRLVLGGSAFNIKSESLRLGDFSEREYALGRGRTDLLIVWPQGGRERRFVVECKVLRKGLERTIAEGVEQTRGYVDRCGAEAGHLIVFDRTPDRTWAEKIFAARRRELACRSRSGGCNAKRHFRSRSLGWERHDLYPANLSCRPEGLRRVYTTSPRGRPSEAVSRAWFSVPRPDMLPDPSRTGQSLVPSIPHASRSGLDHHRRRLLPPRRHDWYRANRRADAASIPAGSGTVH